MVNFPAVDASSAVETPSVLDVGERGGHAKQCGSVGAKEKLTKIRRRPQQLGVARQRLDEMHPFGLREPNDDVVESTQVGCHPALEADVSSHGALGVEEIKNLIS